MYTQERMPGEFATIDVYIALHPWHHTILQLIASVYVTSFLRPQQHTPFCDRTCYEIVTSIAHNYNYVR